MTKGLAAGDVVWLIVRDDDPNHGEFAKSERHAVLKVAWLKQRQNVPAKVIRAVIQPESPAEGDSA